MTSISQKPLDNLSKDTVKQIKLDGTLLEFEFFKYAPRADMAVLAKMGKTSVLITIVSSKRESDLDYFPLQVEYIERLYAGGKIKGSRFIKREGRPSDDAVLIARMIDRSIRPLFPKDYHHEVQIIATVMSVDSHHDPAILASLATQIALHVSDIPWNGPSISMRIGRHNGQLIFNPSVDQMKTGDLDLVVSATRQAIVMIEAGADQVDNQAVIDGLKLFYDKAAVLFDLAEELRQSVGLPKRQYQAYVISEEILKLAEKQRDRIQKLVKQMPSQPDLSWEDLESQMVEEFLAADPDNQALVGDYKTALFDIFGDEARKQALADGKRLDGRGEDEIRSLHLEVGLLPQVHGSGMFQRGQTQVLSVLTLASPALEQIIETMLDDEFKRYIHHYSALPYSVGETGRIGFPRRREVGHGALAEKALEPVLPSEDDFPYTIRIVSEVLSQQGSTSMASTCASTLALMDAGVPIKAPVAGISVGMVSNEKGDYRLLTDIMGVEDHTGDMDFKVAGTAKGITAIQLDVKKMILTVDIAEKVLARSNQARQAILAEMAKIIDKPRPQVSPQAPKITTTQVPEEKIGDVIGSGGQIIKKISKDTGAEINIDDDGRVVITGDDLDGVNKAKEIIDGIVREIQPGETFTGKIVKLAEFGAFIQLYPGRDGLLHISKIPGYVTNINDILKVGQELKVTINEVTPEGKLSLSLAEPIPGYQPQERSKKFDHSNNHGRPSRSGRNFRRRDFNSHR